MSVNTAHASNGVLIHSGEYILLHSDNVSMEFSGQDSSVFKGSKSGRIYLTSHRMIFNNKKPGDEMQSFSAPFITLNDVELEQPVFGANYIKGKVRAQPNGNFVGEVKFKLYFKHGGAIEYGQALLRAATTAQNNFHRGGQMNDDPPPYTPSGAWHEAPPPAYQPPAGYYGWLPTHDAFSGPAPNSVFMSDNPPPYPGIGGPPPYSQQPYQPPQQPWQQPYQQPYQQPQEPQFNGTAPAWGGYAPPPEQQQQGWGGYQPPPSYGAAMQGYNAPVPGGGGYPPATPANYYAGGGQTGYPGGNPYPPQQPPPQQQPPQQPPQQSKENHTSPPPGGASAGGPIGALGFSLPPIDKIIDPLAPPNPKPDYMAQFTRAESAAFPPAYEDLPPPSCYKTNKHV